MKKILAGCAVIMALLSPSLTQAAGQKASAVLYNAEGKRIGMASLVQAPVGVLIHVKVTTLTPGKHGLHLHSHGSCDAATGFKSAKGHVGKKEGGHGFLNPQGPEPGDLPNIFVASDGSGEMEAYTTLVTLGGDLNNLLDGNGSSFIIHENGDDHITQPIGGAGARVACGTIKAG